MTQARTSAAALHHIIATGLVSKQRTEVLEALFEHGPCTARELQELAFAGRDFAHKRLPELRSQHVAEELGTRVCRFGGESATVWDVASGPVVKYESPPTAAEQLVEVRVTIERIAELTKALFEGRHQGVPSYQLRALGEELNQHLVQLGHPSIPVFCFAL